jgi:hypothetical protein
MTEGAPHYANELQLQASVVASDNVTYHDITTPIKLSFNVHLRECWPLGVLFHALAHALVFQDVESLILCICRVQDLAKTIKERSADNFERGDSRMNS